VVITMIASVFSDAERLPASRRRTTIATRSWMRLLRLRFCGRRSEGAMMGTRKPNKSLQNSQGSTSPSAVGKVTGVG
jgi:hypothetical protein